jgi:protoporphyrinogen oxidase
MILILGAGLAGLSCSYHLGHECCCLLEANAHAFGHIHSRVLDGFTWDEGPHVSFTKQDYVRELFAAGASGEFLEKEVTLTNYWRGHWIEHPAQLHLHAVPEPVRSRCVESFLAVPVDAPPPQHYGEWLDQAFGKAFADEFARRYTRKYWTVEAEELATEWIGSRVHRPLERDLLAGAGGPIGLRGHYIQHFRYPKSGGYQQFAARIAEGARIEYRASVERIDPRARQVVTADGRCFPYERLINTLPLPEFLRMLTGLPQAVRQWAGSLRCSRLLLVNVAARQPTPRPNPWLYVYDEDKLSTRINFTELLSPGNAPTGWTGIQVEVYLRDETTGLLSGAQIRDRVVGELEEMGLLEPEAEVRAHSWNVPWANVIFTRATAGLLDKIWKALEPFGLQHESDDTHPLTDWASVTALRPSPLVMAGRFAQWKYYWTDDCILRGKQIAGC